MYHCLTLSKYFTHSALDEVTAGFMIRGFVWTPIVMPPSSAPHGNETISTCQSLGSVIYPFEAGITTIICSEESFSLLLRDVESLTKGKCSYAINYREVELLANWP